MYGSLLPFLVEIQRAIKEKMTFEEHRGRQTEGATLPHREPMFRMT